MDTLSSASEIKAHAQPTLRLVGEVELKICPECHGLGRVACPQTVAVRTIGFNGVPTLQPSTGHPIPCPSCMGKKRIPTI
ncbi:MAG: hypothetical protein ACWA5W_07465 [Phycisphaerales bacterium]